MFISVKGINGRLIFTFDDKVSYENLMKEFESLLDKSVFKPDYLPKAFFDFKSRIIQEFELLQLLEIIYRKQVIIFDGIKVVKHKSKNEIKIIDRTIHGGEILHLQEDTLISGRINPGAIVYFNARLYVLKGVLGIVEGTSEQALISAKEYRNATIRLGDDEIHSFTSFDLTMFYIKNKRIYQDKGDMINV